MFSVMNLIFFAGILVLYLGAKQNPTMDLMVLEQSPYYITMLWCSCCFYVLFGLSHWIFVMNYLTLAIRVKYQDSDQFKSQVTWLNIMYYSFGALNVFTPIIGFAILSSSPTWSAIILMTVDGIWIFRAGVLFVALIILKKSLSAESRVTLNVTEMAIHLTAFTLFLVASVINLE